jgi:hypothetical protein
VSDRSRRPRQARTLRYGWLLIGVLFVIGLTLLALRVQWAAALPAIALIGAVVLIWIEVAPEGGHVHDTGLSAYGVAEPPRITLDHD